ncbi:MAG: PAS domain-containing sensor histidine kinase [Parvibaculum sp.]
MIRPVSTAITPHEVNEGLSPQAPRLSLALVCDARVPGSVFEGFEADVQVIERARGIAPLLSPGLDAILFDVGAGTPDDMSALRRFVTLGPNVPVIALFERPHFQSDCACEAIAIGAEDAFAFDPFNTETLLTPVRLAIARAARQSTNRNRQAGGCSAATAKTSTPLPVADPLTVVQEAADAMIILDNEGKVAFANSAAAELLGRSLESLAGATLDFPVAAGDRPLAIKQPSGEERFADLRIVETEWGGKPARVAALTDTTVRHRLERVMLDAEAKGLTSERRSKSFFSNVNHDLRTPLTHIIGFSELMKEQTFGPLSDRYREYAADIHTSGTLLLDIVEDLLSIAEASEAGPDLNEEICNLSAIIDTAIAGQKHNANANGVTLAAHHMEGLPGLRGDARRLRQGFYRMLAELLHSADRGTDITITTELVGGGLVVKTLLDGAMDENTPCLPYETRETEFGCSSVEDPFVSAEGRRKPRDTGLSLSLTRKIAELHGGTLSAGRDVEGRARVILSLPAARLMR